MPNDNALTGEQRKAIRWAARATSNLATREALMSLLAAHPGQPEPSAELTNAEVRALLQLEEAIRHDRAMFEGTSDEDNPMGSLVTTALKALDAARTGASS
ncbi:hypothetical protein KDX23_10185 [Burkholderia vietnamiensis]|uniref:hypothetical protein n=1 Tax=Burkholderia vietnamiensis TaxID=60552 RepID=UPI001BA22F15|nr:hypothetical protein [Burkholderia vietnamiensis]MBR8083112.1 hypothetical protein [Burkholderia vietnamiensis]